MANLRKTAFIFFLLWCLPWSGHSQVDPVRLMTDLKVLASDSMEGRKTGTIGNEKARMFILKRIKELGLEPYRSNFVHTFKYTVEDTVTMGKNIISMIKGKGDSSGIIVLSAHYDHVGIKGEKIYNGADDNASGVAALLAIAEYFSRNKPNHSILFAFFDAEEEGLKGSKEFVAASTDKIILNVNLDMVSRNDNNEIYIAGTYQNPQLKELLIDLVPASDALKVSFGHDRPGSGGHDWSNSSDHSPFNKAGIPFLYFGVEDHQDYHQPTDDAAKINEGFYVSVVELIIAVTDQLDKKLQ